MESAQSTMFLKSQGTICSNQRAKTKDKETVSAPLSTKIVTALNVITQKPSA